MLGVQRRLVTKDVDQGYLDFLDTLRNDEPKQCNVRTKWKISKCITKDVPSLRVPVWHPDLQLPPKSCKSACKSDRATIYETTHCRHHGASGAIYGVRLLQVLRDVTVSKRIW